MQCNVCIKVFSSRSLRQYLLFTTEGSKNVYKVFTHLLMKISNLYNILDVDNSSFVQFADGTRCEKYLYTYI